MFVFLQRNRSLKFSTLRLTLKTRLNRVGLLFSESNVLDDPSRSRVTDFESRVQLRTKRISEYQSSFLSFLLLFISFAREFNLFGVSLTGRTQPSGSTQPRRKYSSRRNISFKISYYQAGKTRTKTNCFSLTHNTTLCVSVSLITFLCQ